MSHPRKIKVSFNSPVILSFAFVCLWVLILDKFFAGTFTHLLFSVYRSSWLDPLTYIRLIGHVFGHADWNHFFSNMMIFLVIGPVLEEKYGSANILLVIIVTAIVTGIIYMIVFPDSVLLGASGVVFAFILLVSITGLKEGEVPLTFLIVAFIYIGQQIYQGIFIHDNVSNFTHILGGIMGSGFGYTLNQYQKSH